MVAARDAARAAGEAALGPGRGHASGPEAMGGLARAEGALSSALGRLFALVEAYPDLKANQNMMQLAEEITTTENKLAFARQAFNDAVMQLNTALEAFPAVMFAGMLGFRRATPLAPLGSEAERQAPVVRF